MNAQPQQEQQQQQSISIRTQVRVSTGQISSDLGGEVVILDMKQSVYHGLEGAGAQMWNLLQQGKSLEEVRDAIVAEFDVDRLTCEIDLLNLVHELAGNGLIEIVG